ncbi:MAG: hypothetical protein AB1510_00415 [Bacillota bacterium]
MTCSSKRMHKIGTPRGAAGECYIAKWLHPELFRDVNPEAVHKEMLEKFYGEELRVYGFTR